MTATLAHFNFSDQFMGFWGSSGPSQSTIFGSTSIFVVSGSFLSESSLGWPASRSISFSKLELVGDPFPFGAEAVEAGTFSESVPLATSGVEDVVTSGAGRSPFSGSIDDLASGAECGAVSWTDTGSASSFVDVVAPDAVPDAISDGIVPVADEGALATGPDAIPGAIHGSISSGPGFRAFSKLFESAAPSAAGTVARVMELSSEIADESFSGAHWAIVEGARLVVAYLFAAGILACWPLGGRLYEAVAGAVEETGCSGASEKASVVDAKD